MKRSARWFLGFSLFAVAAGSLLVSNAARAEDPAAGKPPTQKKIEHPFILSWVGDWEVTESMNGKESKGKSKIALGAAGTVMVEEYASNMMGMEFGGHGVTKVGDDGKSVTMWWFDNMLAEPIKLTGTVAAESLEVTGAMPGMGALKIVQKKVEGGTDCDFTVEGKPWMTQKYRKAK